MRYVLAFLLAVSLWGCATRTGEQVEADVQNDQVAGQEDVQGPDLRPDPEIASTEVDASEPVVDAPAPEPVAAEAPEAVAESAAEPLAETAADPDAVVPPEPIAEPDAAANAAESQPEADYSGEQFVVVSRMIQLPLWRFNEVLKQSPLSFSEGETFEGSKFLYAIANEKQLQPLVLRLASFGTERDFGKLLLREGREEALAVTGTREILTGADPRVHPRRGVVFEPTKGTARSAGITIKAICTATPEGTLGQFKVELVDNVEAAGSGGNRIAPVVLSRSFELTGTVQERGAAIIIPPLNWNMIGSELDPRLQVLIIGLHKAGPADLF